MDDTINRKAMAVAALAERTDIPAEIALLADAVLELYRRLGAVRSSGLEAFEQIQELGKRQGPGAK